MMKTTNILFLFIGSVLFFSCKSKKEETNHLSSIHAQEICTYLEKEGDYINSQDIPSLINATDVYNGLENNLMVIDIRESQFFKDAHMKGAHNVRPDSILYFFEHIIEPNSFDTIVVVCDIGNRSAYVTALLRFLGYNNVYSMRFGLSSWHRQFAENTWFKAISSQLEGKLDTINHSKNSKSDFPILSLSEQTPYLKLRSRVEVLLKEDLKQTTVDFEHVSKNFEGYYIINYWPYDLYKKGHLSGAIQYTPKQSLKFAEDLLTLPLDKPILLYCYSGQHSSFVTAFLKVLGYDVYNLKYGAHAFIFETLKQTQRASRVFSDMHIQNYPLEQTKETEIEIKMPLSIPVKGGC